MVSPQFLDRFITDHGLPESFRNTAACCYEPLAAWLRGKLGRGAPFLLGINGAQGTGKSTLAAYIALAIGETGEYSVAVLSIDDFYLTRAERRELARSVHPLLATRGVPGTHDIPMLRDCIARLRGLGHGERCRLPRFDKAADERADSSCWPAVTGPIDLVILEGWCVGSVAEADADLDALVFLQAPGFEAILRWRVEQEHKLAGTAGEEAAGIMTDNEVREFIRHFERITRKNRLSVCRNADVVLELDEYHACVAGHYRE